MVDLLPEIVDGLDQNLSLLAVGLELLFQFRSLQQFLLEIKLSEQISSMIGQAYPSVVDSVPEPLYFLSGDGQFLDNCMFEPPLFIVDQLLKNADLFLVVLDKTHQEGFNLKMFN